VIYNLAPNRDDYYTRFGMAWDHEEAKGNALKPWLDPVNLDVQTLGGYNPSSTEPIKIVTGRRFQVFPNPANDLFYITSKESFQGSGYYNIINLSGAVLLRGELDGGGRAEIQSSILAPGLYIVHVGVEGYHEHHKLLVTGQ